MTQLNPALLQSHSYTTDAMASPTSWMYNTGIVSSYEIVPLSVTRTHHRTQEEPQCFCCCCRSMLAPARAYHLVTLHAPTHMHHERTVLLPTESAPFPVTIIIIRHQSTATHSQKCPHTHTSLNRKVRGKSGWSPTAHLPTNPSFRPTKKALIKTHKKISHASQIDEKFPMTFLPSTSQSRTNRSPQDCVTPPLRHHPENPLAIHSRINNIAPLRKREALDPNLFRVYSRSKTIFFVPAATISR